MGEAANERGAIERLEFVEFAAVDEARDDLALVERLLQVGADDAGNFGGIEQRRAHRADVAVELLHAVERADDVAGLGDRLHLVAREMIGDAGDGAVHLRAAQRVAVDDLADRGFHDLRAAEMDAAVARGHHDLVGERRDIGAAGGAFAEHRCDLRNAGGRHPALPVERAAEMILVRKHLVALLQVGAAAIDEIDHRQPVLEGDVLRAHVLADGLLEERAALGGGVVGDDHADHAADRADAGDEARGGHGVVVQPPGGKRRQLQERAERIDQEVDALAHRNLAAVAMALDHAVAAAGERPGLPRAQSLQQAVIDAGIGLEGLGSRIDCAGERCHIGFRRNLFSSG